MCTPRVDCDPAGICLFTSGSNCSWAPPHSRRSAFHSFASLEPHPDGMGHMPPLPRASGHRERSRPVAPLCQTGPSSAIVGNSLPECNHSHRTTSAATAPRFPRHLQPANSRVHPAASLTMARETLGPVFVDPARHRSTPSLAGLVRLDRVNRDPSPEIRRLEYVRSTGAIGTDGMPVGRPFDLRPRVRRAVAGRAREPPRL